VAFVFVIQDNTANMRNVKVVVTEGLNAAVTGINPGDVVANSSFDKLQDKSKIVISKQPLPTTTSGSNVP
jgi:multidrug efflux system membrane fusion protein